MAARHVLRHPALLGVLHHEELVRAVVVHLASKCGYAALWVPHRTDPG
jgi:hypothetical protein